MWEVFWYFKHMHICLFAVMFVSNIGIHLFDYVYCYNTMLFYFNEQKKNYQVVLFGSIVDEIMGIFAVAFEEGFI